MWRECRWDFVHSIYDYAPCMCILADIQADYTELVDIAFISLNRGESC